jgi:hypothetical protein
MPNTEEFKKIKKHNLRMRKHLDRAENLKIKKDLESMQIRILFQVR